MRIESLHIGMKVKHPEYGVGPVKTIGEHTAEIRFEHTVRTVAPDVSGLDFAEAQAAVSGLEQPLALFVADVVRQMVRELGISGPESVMPELAGRWHGGKMVLQPSQPTLQSKEVPLEVFFHKIVMIRNNLRVLEQKINSHEKLTDEEKVDLQGYITRCYGSLTTFNLLFQSKEGQFSGARES